MTDSKAESQQAHKFREIARELECDEDEAAFEDKVRKVATAPKPDDQEGEKDGAKRT